MTRILGVFAILAATAGCDSADKGDRAASPAKSPESEFPAATADRGPPLALAATDPSLKWGPCPPVFSEPGCSIAVLNGDPAKPNADVLLKVPGGYRLPPHRHSSAERMILTSGTLKVRYQGHPEATLASGSYAFGPPGLAHEGSCVSTDPCTLFIAFEGPVDAEAVEGPIG